MLLNIFCAFSFCVNMATINFIGKKPYQTQYQLELQVNALKHLTDLTVHNYTYLPAALEYDIAIEFELIANEIISNAAGDAMNKTLNMVRAANTLGKDTSSCYYRFEQLLVANTYVAIEESASCTVSVEDTYTKLLNDLNTGKKNAEELANAVKGIVQDCAPSKGEEHLKCIESRLVVYSERQKLLEEQYRFYTKKYQEALGLRNEAIECLSAEDKPVDKAIQNSVRAATKCLQDLKYI